jgi:carbon storage regulator
MIGDNIEILVVETMKDRVRIGIRCPSEIPVHRREVYEAIKKIENGPKD